MARIIIFGTEDIAQVAHHYLTHDSEHEIVAFTVHEGHLGHKELMGLPVVPFEEIEVQWPPEVFKMHVAIGYSKLNKIRAAIYAEAKKKRYKLISYVSSRSACWGDTKIGDNCFILEDNTIQPFVSIGSDTCLWSGNHIGHHSTIGDHCFVSSHVVISGGGCP